jgi:hypothetical protein
MSTETIGYHYRSYSFIVTFVPPPNPFSFVRQLSAKIDFRLSCDASKPPPHNAHFKGNHVSAWRVGFGGARRCTT